MSTLKLELPRADYDALHVAAHGGRKSAHVKVSRQALITLLLDHGRALTLLGSRWSDVDETK